MTRSVPVRLVLRQGGAVVAEAQAQLAIDAGELLGLRIVPRSAEGLQPSRLLRLVGLIQREMVGPPPRGLAAVREDVDALADLLEQMDDGTARAVRQARRARGGA